MRIRVPGSGRLHVIPVLHVERLDDEKSFRAAMDFSEMYRAKTGRPCLATVVTPLSPFLRLRLDECGFDVGEYERRIHSLSCVADIGYHGHFLRRSGGPVHRFWPERALVAAQMAAETEWLTARGLMMTRAYSAGWWFTADWLSVLLANLGYTLDFSFSRSKFSFNDWRAEASLPTRRVYSVMSLSGGRHLPFAVRLLRHHRRRSGGEDNIALYSHDWDLDVPAALAQLSDAHSAGASFIDVATLDASASHGEPSGTAQAT